MMSKQEFLKRAKDTFEKCFSLMEKKNADYGADSDPFKNFRMSVQVKVEPARGILVRTSDKISRISNLLDKEPAVVSESIHDTIQDAINYLVILDNLIAEQEYEYLKEPARPSTFLNDRGETNEVLLRR